MVDGAKSRLDDRARRRVPQRPCCASPAPSIRGKENEARASRSPTSLPRSWWGPTARCSTSAERRTRRRGAAPRHPGPPDWSFPLRSVTRVAAATDVVRIQLKDTARADLRIGHMEAAAAVPADGIARPGIRNGEEPRLEQRPPRRPVHVGYRLVGGQRLRARQDQRGRHHHGYTGCALPRRLVRATGEDGDRRQRAVRRHRAAAPRRVPPPSDRSGGRLDISVLGSLNDLAVADGLCGPDRRARG